jgi:hypothetical protein
MKDLDVNSDGFVDIQELARWTLTGMKSYGDAERTYKRATQNVS